MRVEVYKQTSDDWYPSYQLEGVAEHYKNLVRVSFLSIRDGSWRVCCWGADDFGMERDFKEEYDAWNIFLLVIKLEDVTFNKLKELGFYYA